MKLSVHAPITLITLLSIAFTCHAADISLSTECWNSNGWMENGYGNYFVVFSNSAAYPVSVIACESSWKNFGYSNAESLDFTIAPTSTYTLTRHGHLLSSVVKQYGSATPILTGCFTTVANAQTSTVPFSVKIPVATLPEPLVTLSGSYVGVSLQQSRYTNFPAQQTMIRWLDQAYQQMWNLTGSRPFTGEFIVIKECPAHPWWAYAANPIVLNYHYVGKTIDDFNNGIPSFGWLHEMGHVFDDAVDQWYIFNVSFREFQANVKMVYALLHIPDRNRVRMKHPGNTYMIPDKDRKLTVDEWVSVFARYYGDRYLAGSNSWQYMEVDDYLSFFMRIADVYGWNSIEQWYRAYRRLQADCFVPPTSPVDKINLMCAIFSETTGTNMIPAFQLWRLPVSDKSVSRIKERYTGDHYAPAVHSWHILPEPSCWTTTTAFVSCTPARIREIIAQTKNAPLVHSSSAIINLYDYLPFDTAEHATAYALRTITCDEPRTVTILSGSDDALRLWLNGELIQHILQCRAATPDSDSVQVTLHKGANTLLAEISNADGDWSFILRLTDQNNNPLELTNNGFLVKPAAVKTIFDK